MSYTIFKNMDLKVIQGMTPDDYYNTQIDAGINTMDTVDALQYSMQRNTLVGSATATLDPPSGYTITGAAAERQSIYIAVIGTVTVTIVHYDTDLSQNVTDVFSLFGVKQWPAILEVSFANVVSCVLAGAGLSTDSNDVLAYWAVEVEPTDIRLP
jgi:hypothetical protein